MGPRPCDSMEDPSHGWTGSESWMEGIRVINGRRPALAEQPEPPSEKARPSEEPLRKGPLSRGPLRKGARGLRGAPPKRLRKGLLFSEPREAQRAALRAAGLAQRPRARKYWRLGCRMGALFIPGRARACRRRRRCRWRGAASAPAGSRTAATPAPASDPLFHGFRSAASPTAAGALQIHGSRSTATAFTRSGFRSMAGDGPFKRFRSSAFALSRTSTHSDFRSMPAHAPFKLPQAPSL
jgi:hypothetical protein